MASAAIITKPTFTLTDRLRVQEARARDREYIVCGRLTTVLLERQIPIKGFSQSRPRWDNPTQAKMLKDDPTRTPFSEAQAVAWYKTTLDWLSNKKAPLLAISKDQRDLLLPHGLRTLPDIPDPLWVPKKAGEIAPRVPQRLEDRASGILRSRSGRRFLIFHPVIELCVIVRGDGTGGFAKIYGQVDQADGTHLALLVDPDAMQGYFVGGRFAMGG